MSELTACVAMEPKGRRGRQAVILAAAIVAISASGVAAEAPLLSDFDGDGYDDLVVAMPGRDVDGVPDAGAVLIVPGGRDGINPAGATLVLSRAVDGIPGEPTAGERWGTVFQTGDFNSDGYFDLVIGSASATVDGRPGSGDAILLYGSANGLRTDLARQLVPDAELGDGAFGASLQAGHFNADPFLDLAIGAPNAFGGKGAVVVYQADLIGRLATPSVLRVDALEGAPAVEAFGLALAAGAFSGANGTSDELAIAAIPTGGEPPLIFFARPGDGPMDGLSLDLAGIVAISMPADIVQNAGASATLLVAGDFDADGAAGLVAGFPAADVFEDGVLAEGGGVVAILDEARDGALPRTTTPWRQSQSGFQLAAENGDGFGGVLAVGDFDGDGFADLAIGVPSEDDIGLEDRGHIHILYGTPEGFVTTRRVAFHFDLEYVGFRTMFGERGQSSAFDMYGGALGVGDFNGDGRHELAVGIPGKAGPDGEPGVGWVLVLNGSPQGVTTAFSRLVAYRTLTGLDLAAGEGDRFGLTLSGNAADCWRGTLCFDLAPNAARAAD